MRASRGADPKRPTEGRLGTWEALTTPLAGSTLEVRAWAGRTAKTRTAAPNSARQENRASVASSDGRWVITAPATSTMVSLPARLILVCGRGPRSVPKIANFVFPFLMRFFIITKTATVNFLVKCCSKQAIERHLTLESARQHVSVDVSGLGTLSSSPPALGIYVILVTMFLQ